MSLELQEEKSSWEVDQSQLTYCTVPLRLSISEKCGYRERKIEGREMEITNLSELQRLHFSLDIVYCCDGTSGKLCVLLLSFVTGLPILASTATAEANSTQSLSDWREQIRLPLAEGTHKLTHKLIHKAVVFAARFPGE